MRDSERTGLVFFPDWSRDNPYQKLLYAGIERLGISCSGLSGRGFSLTWLFENKNFVRHLHFHWLFGIYDPDSKGLDWSKAQNFLIKIAVAKFLGYKILWTIHNFISHEPTHLKLEILLRKCMARLADHVIVHCNYARDLIQKEWGINPNKITVIPHGSYIGYYSNNVSRGDSRTRLGLPEDDFIFLFFGMIRNYKGLKQLLESFGEVSRINPKARLVIAGRPFDDAIKNDVEKMAEDKRISTFLHYIPDEEVQLFFNASDTVVLPYQNILTSGAALLALSFGKPLVVPNRGCIPDIISDESGFPYNHDRELTETMLRAIRNGRDERREQRCLNIAKKLEWNSLARHSYLPLLGEGCIRESILLITNHLPQFDRASGCFRLFNIIKGMTRKYHVIVYAEWFHKYYVKDNDQYLKALEDVGVEVFLPEDNESATKSRLTDLLCNRSLSAVIIEFFHIAEINVDRIRKLNPSLPIIIDSVDLHFYRMRMMAEISNDKELRRKAEETKLRELAVYSKADYVWTVSDLDKQILLEYNPVLKIEIVPNLHPIANTIPSPDMKKENSLIFVGGFNHPPNTDAILYFCKEILPIIRMKIPGVTLNIVGDSPPPEVQNLKSDFINVTGFVPETKPYLDASYISIAPLRFGAGMKGKVGEALAHGLPVVTSTVGAQGMGLHHKINAWIADTPQEFAEGVIQLCTDRAFYLHLSRNGQDLVRKTFSIDAVQSSLLKQLERVIHPNATRM